MTQPPDLKSFLGGFLAEAEEHLRSANAQLVALDELVRRGDVGHRQVRELFRSMHTIKGLAGMVGVEAIVALAHALESVLREADRSGGRLEPATLDLLQRAIHAVEDRVRALEEGRPVPAAPRELVEALEDLELDEEHGQESAGALRLEPELLEKLSDTEKAELTSGAARGKRAVRVDFVPSAARAAEGMNITRVREDVGRLGDTVKVLPLSRPATADAPGGLAFALLLNTGADDFAIASAAGAEEVVTLLEAAASEPQALDAYEELEPQRRPYVRVDVERLDDALDKLSALVVTGHHLDRARDLLAAAGADVQELALVTADHTRQLRELRAAIMSARLVPVAELLERVPLIVRGLARSTGKQVKLVIETGRAELDKAVGERIFPAIVHLVRNAVDHGIEAPEARRAAGKPEEGTVSISAHARGRSLLELVISDDGRGIDVHELARRAGEPLPATDAALLDLLTRPGLSTKKETTTTSGRGMGVDIIRRIAVNELGGEFSLVNTPGAGAAFSLRVPLSITILDAISFRCADQTFLVPVANVEELIELLDSDVVQPPGDSTIRLLRRRGEAIPLLDLSAALGLPRSPHDRPKAILIRRGGETFAFEVDRLCGQQEVVVRPLPDPLVRVPGVTGTTDLGDGVPSLVLDLLSLRALAAERQEA